MFPTKSGTGTWGLGREDAGTWGLGDARTWGLWDVGTWRGPALGTRGLGDARGNSGTWGRVDMETRGHGDVELKGGTLPKCRFSTTKYDINRIEISRSRFKQYKYSILIPLFYVLGCFVNFWVYLGGESSSRMIVKIR